jgi:hypothetical protein
VHLLARSGAAKALAGRSDAGGFYLYGDVDSEALRAAVDEAILRLAEEPELAIHPHCGTNLVVGGLTAGLGAALALATLPVARRGAVLGLLPRFFLAGTAAALAGSNLGPLVQRRWTTLADAAGVTVTGIRRSQRGRHVIHRVGLADGA